MTLSSMTGFARVSGQSTACGWTWELRSVNAKGFDCRVRLPSGWENLEAPVRQAIAASLPRGTVHAALDIVDHTRAPSVRINMALLEDLATQTRYAASALGLALPTIDSLLQIRGVVEAPEQTGTSQSRTHEEAGVMNAMQDALAALVQSRQGEGAALQAVLSGHLDALDANLIAARETPGRHAAAIRERIQIQVRELIGSSEGLDPQRLHQEALLIAIRADIQEELDRLAAHLKDARVILGNGGPVGRKLDFLSQELSREVNTLCAKSNDVTLTGIGLAMKGRVEQFREQVQNVE